MTVNTKQKFWLRIFALVAGSEQGFRGGDKPWLSCLWLLAPEGFHVIFCEPIMPVSCFLVLLCNFLKGGEFLPVGLFPLNLGVETSFLPAHMGKSRGHPGQMVASSNILLEETFLHHLFRVCFKSIQILFSAPQRVCLVELSAEFPWYITHSVSNGARP